MIVTVCQPIPVRRHLGFHRHGNENVWRLSHLHSKETGTHHSHDGHGNSVHNQLPVHNSGIAAESALPISIAQHNYGIRTWRGFILRIQNTSEGSTHAQHFKIISSY